MYKQNVAKRAVLLNRRKKAIYLLGVVLSVHRNVNGQIFAKSATVACSDIGSTLEKVNRTVQRTHFNRKSVTNNFNSSALRVAFTM